MIGGGAAGMMAALWSARTGAKTLLINSSKQLGLKILISGGGRCNVLPSVANLDDYFTTGSRNTLKRLFQTWPLAAVHDFFEEDLGVELALEPASGKFFPRSQQAATVRDALQRACLDAGVEIKNSWRLESLTENCGSFRLDSSTHLNSAINSLQARRVVLATGGISLPKTGSDGHGFTVAKSFGHRLNRTYPALVPLTTGDSQITQLAGISLPVRWQAVADGRVLEQRVRELLFTHRGFSGPAILDASHWFVRDRVSIIINWLDRDESTWMAEFEKSRDRSLGRLVAQHLPKRLANFLCEKIGLDDSITISQLTKTMRKQLLGVLCAYPLQLQGNTGYRVAEVTGGGIPLEECSPKTLESRKQAGLYLCGEILDLIGRMGGYNFLWAWVTGRLAGESAARAALTVAKSRPRA